MADIVFCKHIGNESTSNLAFFLIAGVYANINLLLLAAALATSMVTGVFIGRHLTLKLTREQFVKVVNMLVLASGVFLLIRYFS